ncbi:hypothetical protein LCGC14_2306960, partial [marine sediment metagenome]
TTVLLGDTVEVPVWVLHEGAAETKEIYAAIGTKGITFDEHLAGSQMVSFRQDAGPTSYVENVSIRIPAGTTPGVYDVYAKVLRTSPLEISPIAHDVLEIRAAAEQFILTVRQEPAVGQVSISPDKVAYDRLDVVQLRATVYQWALATHEFDRWEINGSIQRTNPSSVIMMRDSVAVVFYRQKAAAPAPAPTPPPPEPEPAPPPAPAPTTISFRIMPAFPTAAMRLKAVWGVAFRGEGETYGNARGNTPAGSSITISGVPAGVSGTLVAFLGGGVGPDIGPIGSGTFTPEDGRAYNFNMTSGGLS